MMMSSSASINKSTPSRCRKVQEESSQQEKKKARPNVGTRIGERGLPLIVMAVPFLPCRDIGRLLLCTSKALLVPDNNNANDVAPTPTEWVYKCLCLQYWGAYSAETDPEAFGKEFVQKTGLQSYERCFRELSHFETIRRPHKYFYPFSIADTAAIPPPPRTVNPSDFTLVVNIRRRITGKRLLCAALTGSPLVQFFKNGFLPVELASRHRPHTELEDSDMDIQTTTSGDKLFSWDGLVHLIRRSDQTVVKLLDLHKTDTLYKHSIVQEKDLIQDSREWKFRDCLLPKTWRPSRITGLTIPCDPPHQELSLPSLFGCGIIRLGLILEYTRNKGLSSPFHVSGFRLHANLLSRRLQQEFPLFALLEETDWHFSHVLQMLHVFSNDVARDATN